MESVRVEVEAWETKDGEVFYDEHSAEKHEEMLEFYEHCFHNFNMNENATKYFLNAYKDIILSLIEDY